MFGIGLGIGKNERISKKQHNLYNHNNGLFDDNMDSNRNNAFSSKGMFSIRQDVGQNLGEGCYKEGKITIGCTRSAFETMKVELKTILSQIEKDALDEGIRLCDEKIGE